MRILSDLLEFACSKHHPLGGGKKGGGEFALGSAHAQNSKAISQTAGRKRWKFMPSRTCRCCLVSGGGFLRRLRVFRARRGYRNAGTLLRTHRMGRFRFCGILRRGGRRADGQIVGGSRLKACTNALFFRNKPRIELDHLLSYLGKLRNNLWRNVPPREDFDSGEEFRE